MLTLGIVFMTLGACLIWSGILYWVFAEKDGPYVPRRDRANDAD